MQLLPKTTKFSQVHGFTKQTETNEWKITSSRILCACKPCRLDPSNTGAYKYYNIRDLVTHVVRYKSNSSDDDPSGIDKILV